MSTGNKLFAANGLIDASNSYQMTALGKSPYMKGQPGSKHNHNSNVVQNSFDKRDIEELFRTP